MTKNFSPAGMATKDYFGLGARVFGNPDGATKGGGAYAAGGDNPNGPNQGGGPGSGPPPINFNYRGNPFGTPVYTAQTDGLGNTLLITRAGTVWKSTDGAHSFTNTGLTLSPFSPTVQNVGPMMFSNGTFMCGQDQYVHFTTNTGASWTTVQHHCQQAGGIILGSKAINDWIIVGNIIDADPGATNIYSLTTNNGVTWSQAGNVTPIFGTSVPTVVFWDGTRYMFGTTHSGAQAILQSSTDGVNWAKDAMLVSGLAYTNIYLIGGVYYGIAGNQGFTPLFSSPTFAGLLNPPTNVDTGIGAEQLFLAGSNVFVVNTFGLQVANATSLAGPFATGTINLPAPNAFLAGAFYDPVNASAILIGDQGGVSTFP